MKLEKDHGFVDASALLRCGVFVLLWRGEVVFVGKSSGPMLAKIAAMRSADRPKFLPKINFDEVLIRTVHPDALQSTYAALIAEYQPIHNLDQLPATAPISIERRRLQ